MGVSPSSIHVVCGLGEEVCPSGCLVGTVGLWGDCYMPSDPKVREVSELSVFVIS